MAFGITSKYFQYTVRDGERWLVCARESAEKCVSSAASCDCSRPWECASNTLGKV